MNLQSESIREALAAEYVVGTLRGQARQRFERLLPDNADLQNRVGFWEEALQPLADKVTPVQPAVRVWTGIQTSLGFIPNQDASPLPRLRWWRGAGLSFALAVLLTAVLVFGPVEEARQFTPDIEVALTNKQSRPVWVVDADSTQNTVVVKTMRKVVVPDNKSLELWLVLASGEPPVSLGLMPTGHGHEYIVHSSIPLDEGIGFAVSLEPKGGSPTGQATGPILYIQTYRDA